MKFEENKEGRILSALPSELHCKGCKKAKESDMERWYYYDLPIAEGLYCRRCAIDKEVPILPGGRSMFNLIDIFKYGSGQKKVEVKQ